MRCETIQLDVCYEKAGRKKGDYQPTLAAMIQQPQFLPKPRPAVIICPGGGYSYTSSRESEAVAVQYLAAGFQAFVLYYSCEPAVFPSALLELAQSVAIVRDRSDEWGIDPNRIMVAGFSAGGHLAASLGCFWNREFVCGPLGRTPEDIRPNGNILCYPVITSGTFAHRGSFDKLLNGLDPNTYLELTSLELQAGSDNPPTFLWHTNEDGAVPVENSLLYVASLRKAGVPVEFHLFPKGSHGLSLANEETKVDPNEVLPHVQSWMPLSIQWIRDI